MEENKKYIIIDLETTGLNPNLDRVCQVAIIKDDGTELNTLVNPEIKINPSSTKLHNITNEMVKDAPKFIDISEELIKLLRDTEIFIAYNFQFDFQFLQNELYRTRSYVLNEKDFIFIDPYKIFKKMFPHNLANAYKFYTGKELVSAHNALIDAKATKEILEKQKEQYSELFSKSAKEIEQEVLGDTSVTGKWFSKEGDYYVFRQGKYKGEQIKLVHKDYLIWIHSLEDISLSERRVINELIGIGVIS